MLTLCLFVGPENLGIGKQRKREEEKVYVLIKQYTYFLKGAYKSSLRDSIYICNKYFQVSETQTLLPTSFLKLPKSQKNPRTKSNQTKI